MHVVSRNEGGSAAAGSDARRMLPSSTGGSSGDIVIALCLAATLIVLALVTTGGVDESITVSSAGTWAEIVITLLGAAAVASALVLSGPGRLWGATTVVLFAALTALTALSIVWSVQPDNSWQAANLTLSYLAAFAGAAALARLGPGHWRALVWAIALVAVGLSAYALARKVFPVGSETLGRIQTPLGYWNSIGLMGAIGIPPCLWIWSRRESRPTLRGLAVPALSILISVVVLSYSRSAAIAAVIALGCWLAFVPRRLSAASLMALGALGAAIISGWALSKPGLTSNNQPLSLRTSSGHTFGIVLLVCIVAFTAIGIAAARTTVSLSDAARRRIGTALLIGIALVPVAAVVGLAASSRGLTGEISHAWNSLTNVNSVTSDTASRFGSLGSSRPLYWSEGIKVGEHALFKGVGALGFAIARTRYANELAYAVHAHSYVVQTFADLGLLGLVLSLALLVSWGVSAARAIAWRTPWTSLNAAQVGEREGLIALVLVVVAFGVQSTIDWTWFFPGVAIPVLLCAGWLSGRGPLSAPVGIAARRASLLARPAIAAGVTAIAAVSLLLAWLIWQPLSSADSIASAENAAVNKDFSAAFADAHAAAGSDPLALEPLFVLSELYLSVRNRAAARAELVKAVQLQPENSQSWYQLGSFDLATGQVRRALPSLRRAFVLDPTVPQTGQALATARAQIASDHS
jgi:O-antigen ligase/polysaccharide polymerase Wzy-like membrane protein